MAMTQKEILELNEVVSSMGVKCREVSNSFDVLSQKIILSKEIIKKVPFVVGEQGQEIIHHGTGESWYPEEEIEEIEFTHYCGYCGNFFHPLFVSCVSCGGRAEDRIPIIEEEKQPGVLHFDDNVSEKDWKDQTANIICHNVTMFNDRLTDEEIYEIMSQAPRAEIYLK